MDVQVDVAAIGALPSKKEERPCRADQVRLVPEIYTLTQINLLEETFQLLSHNPARLSKNKRPTRRTFRQGSAPRSDYLTLCL